MSKHISLIILCVILREAKAIDTKQLYDTSRLRNLVTIPRGDDQFQVVSLDVPVHLYGEKYESIYINTNGLLSLRSEFPHFSNVPFPLEVAAIAPFYSNIDISLPNDTAQISYTKTSDADLLARADDTVRSSFSDAADYQAQALFIAKWENVGHYDGKNSVSNTFQVVVICSQDATYVQFLYPQGGINWIQGDISDSGLPDIRSQVGFVSEDRRSFSLKGSGTDRIRHVTESSNIGERGVYLYRVGPISSDGNVQEPDLVPDSDDVEPTSCAAGGRYKCHSKAFCQDTEQGFCCNCREGYYGDGLTCINNDAPIRVSGNLRGDIGDGPVDAMVQSYVVTGEGRTYTAISQLTPEIGAKLQLAQIIGGTVGWLFAKPIGDLKNGFQLTGGRFNSTGTLHFEGTENVFRVNQYYNGLNVYDQLALEVEISGSLPDVPIGAKLQLNDFTQELSRTGDKVSSVSRHVIKVLGEDREISFNLFQEITFDSCKYSNSPIPENTPVGTLKSTRISLNYDPRERAVRLGALNKIGNSNALNPCDDGTHTCGDSSQCVPSSDDTYDCICESGYEYSNDNPSVTNCVDIDECSTNYHTCARDAACINQPGTFNCVCNSGFDGNGYQCDRIRHQDAHQYTDDPRRQRPDAQRERPTEQPYIDERVYTEPSRQGTTCQYCSPYASCVEGECVCNPGYHGNGQDCTYNCRSGQVWNGDSCDQISAAVEYETDPHCTVQGCVCPAGYKLVDMTDREVCQLEDSESDDNEMGCDLVNNCSPAALCEWNGQQSRYECVCSPGFHGDGIDCREKDISCTEADICDEHALCTWDQSLRTSVCICEKGYEGNGKVCHLAAECTVDTDCGHYSHCGDGICTCDEGYERDSSDLCVLAGSCGGAYCAENAICQWEPIEKISYCHCPDGFEGDGVRTCKSIPPPCNIRNNCGLQASCIPTNRGVYECACNSGFTGDGFVCTPERNCKNFPDMCDPNATCENTVSGLKCVCRTGFLGNGTVCHDVPKIQNGFLFISHGAALVRIPFNGRNGRPVAGAQMAIGVAKDCAEGRIYWSDITDKSIKSINYEGRDLKVFLRDNIQSPEGIAIDWISRRIYWTDSGKDTIEVASLEDPRQRAVLINKGLVNPRGIAVDPIQEKLYWSDWDRSNPKIEFSNLDGSERQILLDKKDVKLPNSLVVRPQTSELCYNDAGNSRIECVDTYTRIPHTIAANLSYPFGLAVTEDNFYWTDWTTKKIEMISHQGVRGEGIRSPLFGSHKMYGVAAIDGECPLYHSPCTLDNGRCPSDRICLTNRQSPSGLSCKCIDNKSCNEATSPETVF